MRRRRLLLLVVVLAAIAAFPLRAFGLAGGASGLAVDASLGGCGGSGGEILCEIQVAFGGVEGATHYTASVTRADGTVQNAGTVGTGGGGGSTSIQVPYVGAGTYSVIVSAWGPEQGASKPKLLERDGA